jgi:hypothetical protein
VIIGDSSITEHAFIFLNPSEQAKVEGSLTVIVGEASAKRSGRHGAH